MALSTRSYLCINKMVFFTCNNCGESLKKNIVQKHSFKCRSSQGVSCMDCSKNFGEDFVNHSSCITEQEKYGDPNFVPKESKNKKKQEQWVEKVVQAWKSDALTKVHFNRFFSDSNKSQNIPRNIGKLKNFLKNSCHVGNDIAEKFCQIASQVLEREKSRESNNCDASQGKRKNEDEDSCVSVKKIHLEEAKSKIDAENEVLNCAQGSLKTKSSKKNKRKEECNGEPNKESEYNSKINLNKENNSSSSNKVDETAEPLFQNGNPSKFKWKSTIKSTLKAHNNKMKVRKLEKIVVRQYLSNIGDDNLTDEAKELFHNKIKNNKFLLEGKYIHLK